MAAILAILALAAGTFWLEAPGLIRQRYYKELVIFLVLLLIGSALYGTLMLQVKLPNPFMMIKWMYSWVGQLKLS
ncbi:hypothetical protein [Paenibacillus sp. YAF4_2]|uniref:hypothetical protein n=1 Tax=Paenibacillus sp. YAF4_2 TaxID=3233085 RepID=UPI003F9E26DA